MNSPRLVLAGPRFHDLSGIPETSRPSHPIGNLAAFDHTVTRKSHVLIDNMGEGVAQRGQGALLKGVVGFLLGYVLDLSTAATAYSASTVDAWSIYLSCFCSGSCPL